MRIFVIFLFIVSSVYAGLVHEYPAPAIVTNVPKVTTGVSSQSRAQDNLGNYAFSYKEDHIDGGTFRKESGNALGQVIGSYGLRDADGRVRIVNYVADDVHGFRVGITTNEPGTAAQAPAATSISSPHTVLAPSTKNHGQIAIENIHHPSIDTHLTPDVKVSERLEPVYAQPTIIYQNRSPLVVRPNIIEAPVQLIKTYATSIYGPSLLTDNILFTKTATKEASYVPPLTNPIPHRIPIALQTQDGAGFYEPTLVYSNPSGIGYALGTNVGQFGYQLMYRKKKK